MTETKLDAIREKIKSLLAMTELNGCTEAEAMNAAKIAATLMQKYRISEGEILFDEVTHPANYGLQSIKSRIWGVIAHYTNTAGSYGSEGVRFIGSGPWPLVAKYLAQVCENCIENELRAFKKSNFYKRRRTPHTKRQATNDFLSGLVERLSYKIAKLFMHGVDKELSAAAWAEQNRRSPFSRTHKFKSAKSRYHDAKWMGDEAGRRASIHHATEAGKSKSLLEAAK